MIADVCLRICLKLALIFPRPPAGPRCPESVEDHPEPVEGCGTHLAFIRLATLLCLRTALASGLALVLVVQVSTAVGVPTFGPEVSYATKRVLGVRAQVVVVDLNSPTIAVDVELPRGGLRASEPFGSIISRTKPVAAITGTFFCTRSSIPIGDIVKGGHRVNAGAIGACLAFTPDNKARVVPARKGVGVDWSGTVTGLRTGPQLVSDGSIRINGRREGFRDRGLLLGRRMRAAIGVTSRNKLLLVAVRTPVTLSELAKVMRALGAVDAINLDGGSSTGLSYGGRVLVRPGRRMTNVLIFTRRSFPPVVPPTVPAPVARLIIPASAPAIRELRLAQMSEDAEVSSFTPVPRPSAPAEPEEMTSQTPEQQAMLPESLGVRDPSEATSSL